MGPVDNGGRERRGTRAIDGGKHEVASDETGCQCTLLPRHVVGQHRSVLLACSCHLCRGWGVGGGGWGLGFGVGGWSWGWGLGVECSMFNASCETLKPLRNPKTVAKP